MYNGGSSDCIFALIIARKVQLQIVATAITHSFQRYMLFATLYSMFDISETIFSIDYARATYGCNSLKYLILLFAAFARHRGYRLLDYTRLLGGYLSQRSTQQIGMVKADVCHHTH